MDQPRESNVIPLHARTNPDSEWEHLAAQALVQTATLKTLDEVEARITASIAQLHEASAAVSAVAQKRGVFEATGDPVAYTAELTGRLDDIAERLRDAGIGVVAAQTVVFGTSPPPVV
jgi:DNA-binding ferritin-like protein